MLSSPGTLAGLQPKSLPMGAAVIDGGVVSSRQLYITVLAAEVLLQVSVAVIVKVRTRAQASPLSACVTFITRVPEQLSVAVTPDLMLSSLGRLAGLQPKSLPMGAAVIDGGVVSSRQLYTTVLA